MKIDWFYIRMLILLGLSVFLVVFATRRNAQRRINDIAISFTDESSPFVTRETVNKLLILNGQKAAGTPKEDIALSRMEAQVRAHPIVKSAAVYITTGGKLGVDVSQRKPIARINAATPFYIDEDGETMPLSANFSARVPLVTGVDKKDAGEVFTIVDFIRKDNFLHRHIVGMTRKKDGEYVLEARKVDYKILLGIPEKLNQRLNNYKAFYQKALKDKSLENYQKIVLKYDNQVVCER